MTSKERQNNGLCCHLSGLPPPHAPPPCLQSEEKSIMRQMHVKVRLSFITHILRGERRRAGNIRSANNMERGNETKANNARMLERKEWKQEEKVKSRALQAECQGTSTRRLEARWKRMLHLRSSRQDTMPCRLEAP
jgi:hypothetical protein